MRARRARGGANATEQQHVFVSIARLGLLWEGQYLREDRPLWMQVVDLMGVDGVCHRRHTAGARDGAAWWLAWAGIARLEGEVVSMQAQGWARDAPPRARFSPPIPSLPGSP